MIIHCRTIGTMFRTLKGLLFFCTIAGQHTISSSISTMNAIFGSQVIIDCNVDANETIDEVIWERSTANGNTTFSPDIIGISGINPEHPSLTISVASTLDSGLYTCYIKTYNKTIQGNSTRLEIKGAIPTINVESNSLSGIYGISITLYVNISATPSVNHIYWTKVNENGERITISSRSTGYEGGNASVPSLTISNPVFTDKGLYTCHARNAFGVGHSNTIYIDIKGDVPIVSLDAFEIKVSYGSLVSLNCTVTAFPNHTRIYWKKHKNDIITTITPETEGISGSSIGSPTLIIKFVTLTDTGSYMCVAENSVGIGSSRSTLLTVTGGRPFVTIGRTMYSAVYGTSVTLHCGVTGNPPPVYVYWHKKSYGGVWSTITHGSYGIQGVNVTQPSLTILFPVKSDGGEYICIAVNVLGSSSSLPSLLTVTGETPLLSVRSFGNSAEHGASHTFYCTVKATPDHHKVYWEVSKNNVVRKITSETAGIRGVKEDDPSLTINFVTISDEGLYTCVAVNIVGTGKSQSIQLSVDAAAPLVTAMLPSYSVTEDSVVTLLCTVKSKPEHTNVYWQKETVGSVTILKKGTTGIIGASVDNPSITFTNVGRGDSGHYICFATNNIGTGSSRTILLEVEPLIESSTTSKILIVTPKPVDNTASWIGTIVGIFTAIFIMGGTIIAFFEYNRKGKHCKSCKNDSEGQEECISNVDTDPSAHGEPSTNGASGTTAIEVGSIELSDLENRAFAPSLLDFSEEQNTRRRTFVKIGRINVSIIQGTIAEETVDVIVNSVNRDLDLETGLGSKALADAGGNAIQKECCEKYPNGITKNEVAVTNGGNLKCREVYHVTLPKWEMNNKQAIETATTNCLTEAHKSCVNSLAFPPFGSGYLNYPDEDLTDAMLQSVMNFEQLQHLTRAPIKSIVIVCHSTQNSVFKAFERKTRELSGAISQGGSHSCTCGNINVVIKKGNITKQWCDVMVITGSKDLKLKYRKLSRLVLDAAGPDIQTACDIEYPFGVNYREVAFTRAYKLHCRLVFFGCLPDWKNTSDNPQQVLTDFITKCLEFANSQFMNHIAFPTLGTGALKYPHHVMAKTMKSCIENFNQKHMNYNTRFLQHVTIVIFDKSKDCRVMENALLKEFQVTRGYYERSCTTDNFNDQL